jgi:uncharacterized membrane protein YcaP (DUF421 family)
MPDWQLMFAPTVPLVESVIRGTVLYLVVLLLMRLVGQRESGGLGITDVLLVVLVAEAAAPGLHGEASSLVDALVLVGVLMFWSVCVDALAYRFPRMARIVKARPRPLIEDGKLNRRVMRREFMTRQEVESQLRLHGIDDITGVERAYLEPNGMISILRRDERTSEPVEPPAVG